MVVLFISVTLKMVFSMCILHATFFYVNASAAFT